MKKAERKKLTLRQETIAVLTEDAKLQEVRGGTLVYSTVATLCARSCYEF